MTCSFITASTFRAFACTFSWLLLFPGVVTPANADDGDEAGVKASKYLARTYGLGYLDFERHLRLFKLARKEGVKDIADLYQKNADNPNFDPVCLVAYYITSCISVRLSYEAANKFYKAHRDKWGEEYASYAARAKEDIYAWFRLWKLLRERHSELVDNLATI